MPSRTTLHRIGRVYRWNERPLASITDDEAATMLHDIAEARPEGDGEPDEAYPPRDV